MNRFTTAFFALALSACGAPGSPSDGEIVDPAGHPGVEVDEPQLEPDPAIIPTPPRCVLPRPGTECVIPSDPVRARDLIVLSAYCESVGHIRVTSEATQIENSTWAGFDCVSNGLMVGAFNLNAGVLLHSAEDGSHVLCEQGDKPGDPPRVTGVRRAVLVDGEPRHVPAHECETGDCAFIDPAPCELPAG